MIVAYRGYANTDGYGSSMVMVQTKTVQHPLPHDVRHSPDGFSWGYAGSGPSELARCLLMHFMGREDVPTSFYQQFKFDVIARLPQQEDWVLTADQVRDWIRSQALREGEDDV